MTDDRKASERTDVSGAEQREAEKRSGPESIVLYQAVVLKGEHELGRPFASLWWSALAAGIAISASLVAEAALRHHLPDAPWRELITALGYPVGFLIVILGRLQLFTEHTVVAVMPVIGSPSGHNLGRLARLWGIVFLANQLGTFLVAAAFVGAGVVPPWLAHSMVEVSKPMLGHGMWSTMMLGIPAGFLIATVAWLIVAAKSSHFWLIALLTYVIAIGGFTHVIASAVDAYVLVLTGNASMGWALVGFVLPALVGNVIGGTGLFALLAFGQIKEEI
ncbi:formate/nitrite transporter family protein [Sphingomonas sabuli]|uniref:Formate/nitrite transporter family protein n=1 Tax=Sphingomonas sabuli TaxID=2764186 RepID=A0A7G9L130_9SPHN|nr:formate/nitrite transporter family protein [Sphingomonas sabuli]QNM82329.1 formate/nitrite transporter family protein [Sphingomonas sabuli]